MASPTHAFGVDIGGTSVKLGLFATDGELVDSWEIPTITDGGGIQILPDIAGSIRQAMAATSLSPAAIAGIGVGAPGPVRAESVVLSAANLGWGELDVASELSELTGIETVKVSNDANVATLGEQRAGAGLGHDSMLMITIGTGIGGGVIVDGRIIDGVHGAAGEIGHMCVNPAETASCGCGKAGHLEQYVSATGIVSQTRKALATTETPSTLREAKYLAAKDVVDAAKAGDALAVEVFERVTDMLGHAAAIVATVTDPEIIVLGGGVSKAGQFLLEAVAASFRRYAFRGHEATEFAIATLGNAAGIHGAAHLVL